MFTCSLAYLSKCASAAQAKANAEATTSPAEGSGDGGGNNRCQLPQRPAEASRPSSEIFDHLSDSVHGFIIKHTLKRRSLDEIITEAAVVQ